MAAICSTVMQCSFSAVSVSVCECMLKGWGKGTYSQKSSQPAHPGFRLHFVSLGTRKQTTNTQCIQLPKISPVLIPTLPPPQETKGEENIFLKSTFFIHVIYLIYSMCLFQHSVRGSAVFLCQLQPHFSPLFSVSVFSTFCTQRVQGAEDRWVDDL